VVVLGGGKEGVAIARRLAAAGVHTKIVERDPDVCEEITQSLDETLVLNGDAMDQALLADEGAPRAEMVIAALGDETDNIFAALMAKRLGARRVAALVDIPAHMPLRLDRGRGTSSSARSSRRSTRSCRRLARDR